MTQFSKIPLGSQKLQSSRKNIESFKPSESRYLCADVVSRAEILASDNVQTPYSSLLHCSRSDFQSLPDLVGDQEEVNLLELCSRLNFKFAASPQLFVLSCSMSTLVLNLSPNFHHDNLPNRQNSVSPSQVEAKGCL